MLLTRKPPYDTMTNEQFRDAIIADYIENGHSKEIAEVEADKILQREKADKEKLALTIKTASKEMFGEELTEEQLRSIFAAEAISNDEDLTEEQLATKIDSCFQLMMLLFA